MEPSYRYKQLLNTVFSSYLSDNQSVVSNRYVSLSKNNAFSKNLVCDISNLEDFEIPIYARDAFERIISSQEDCDKIVIPLYSNCSPVSKRTSDSILNEFYVRTTFSERIKKIITSKGEVYYGSRGLIFNKDFKPLLIHTVKVRRESPDIYVYYELVLHVSPLVFTTNGILEKSIIKKVIPTYLTESLGNVYMYHSRTSLFKAADTVKITIVIDDVSYLIYSPTVPDSSCIEETFNKCISDNKEEILYNFNRCLQN